MALMFVLCFYGEVGFKAGFDLLQKFRFIKTIKFSQLNGTLQSFKILFIRTIICWANN